MSTPNPFEDPNFDGSVKQGTPNPFADPNFSGRDGALVRGAKTMSKNVGISAGLVSGDTAETAKRVAELDAYSKLNPKSKERQALGDAFEKGDGFFGGLKGALGQVGDNYNKAGSFVGGLRSLAKDAYAMGEAVVEQTPNMLLPTAGMVAGGAAGSTAGPVGTVVGAFTGGAAGNTMVEGGSQVMDALAKANINPSDTAAVKAYLDKNGDKILGQSAVKGSVLGAVDVATAGFGHGILNAPIKEATGRALKEMGVDMADKAAVKAAMNSPAMAERLGADAILKQQSTGLRNIGRNAGAAALEPAGEFTGEFVGQGLATGDWDTKGAGLEALSSIGQSGAMYAGQKAVQFATAPNISIDNTQPQSDGTQPPVAPGTTPVAPPEATPPAVPTLGQSLTGTPMSDLMGGGGLTGGANPLQAGLSTLTSNNQMYPGMNTEPTGYTVDPETGAIIPAEPVGVRQVVAPSAQVEAPAPVAQSPVAPAPAAPALGESLTGTPVADMLDTRTPSQRMGLNPAAGGLTAAAAIAVDSGASPVTAGMGLRALSGAAPASQPVAEQSTPQQQAQPPAQQPILNNGKPFTLAEVGKANQSIGGTAVSVPGGWAIQPPATTQQPAATPATAMPTAATPAASAQSAILGRNSQPIAEGGQPFATREEAKAEKRLQPLMRVAPAEGGGFILKPASERQLAAVEKAAKRLKYPSTGETGPRSLHGFILQIGGLASGAMPDVGFDLNPRVGSRRLFSPRGKTIEQAAMAAKQEGYIQDEDENTLIEALKRSLNVSPVYTPDGYEAMAEAQMRARYEDYLAAEQESGAENDWSRLTPEELADTGYNDYDEATQAEIRALVAQAEALGVDAESILEDVAQRTENATQKDYENAAKSAIEAAIRSSEESRSRDLGQAGAEAGPATADTPAAPAAVTGPASDVRARNLAALKARMMAGQTKPTPTTPPAPNQQATQAAEQEKPLPPSLSAKLQEAHRALGRDVTRSQVQRMRDSVAREVETGTTNNGGVIGKLTPKAVATRREQLQKLDADLALFDGQQATPAPEAGPTNQGATNGQGQETLLKAGQPTGAAAMVSGAPVADSGAFDSAAWNKSRDDTIKESKKAGNKHLDDLPKYVESMRGKKVYYAHDPKVTGTVRTVDNRGNVYIDWADEYSASKESASPVVEGKKTVMRSALGSTDLRDYVVGTPAKSSDTTKPGGFIDKAKKAAGKVDAPKADKPQVFKTADAADYARAGNPAMQKRKVKGGYILVERTAKQIAAAANNARKNFGKVNPDGGPLSAHQYIASEGGIAMSAMAELGFDRNLKVGSKFMFTKNGMTLERMTEALQQAGYMDGTNQNEAIKLVSESAKGRPQYTADGWEQIAQADANVQFDDFMAAQEEMAQADDFNPFDSLAEAGFLEQDADAAGFYEQSEQIQNEISALQSSLESMNIDPVDISDSVHRDNPQATQDEFYARYKAALQQAIAAESAKEAKPASSGSARQDAGGQSGAGAQSEGLTSPTKADIEAQQARAEQAAKAKAAQEKADAARAAKERERKEVAAASVAAADTFELGQDAMANLTGQQDVFGAMEQDAQPTPPKATELTPKQFHEAKLAFIAADTGASMADVRENYDTEAGRAENNREWAGQVESAADAGDVLTRQTLDKLYEMAPNVRLPETAIPQGYQRPEARKAEAEDKQARVDGRKAAKAGVKDATPSFTDLEKELQAKSHAKELSGDVGIVAGGGVVRYVSIDDAVSAAKKAIESGVKAVPFQIHNTTGIRIGDVDRVLEQVNRVDYSKRSVDWLRQNGGDTISVSDAIAALVEKQKAITGDVKNWTERDEKGHPVKGIALYNDSAAKKLDAISWAITNLMGHRKKHGDAPLNAAKAPDTDENKVPLSSVIDKVNAKNGQGLTDADLVPEQKPESKTPSVDAHSELMDAVRDGKATPDQFKTGFEAVVNGADAIKAELATKTKADLLKMGGYAMRMRYANDTKPEIIDALYREMLGEFVLGESLTYGMGKNSYQNAIRQRVEATDADKLAKYAVERKAAMEEYAQRRFEAAKAIANPQKLEDFRGFIRAEMLDGKTRQEAYLALSPEQRIRFDELEAESTREARESRKRAQKTQVQAAGQTTGGQIVETKHTKTGQDLFVVQLSERLSKEDYTTVLASAKRLGGWYSAFRGNGAVPGFQFKEKASAEAFLRLAGGDTSMAAEQVAVQRDAFEDDKTQTAAERLNEMADKLEERADEELGRERNANTTRRARFAASAEAAASNVKALAKTMRNIAKAIGGGTAKFLDAVRTKTQVEMLSSMVHTAKYNELVAKFPEYADREKRKGEPPTVETADFAEFPTFTAFRSDLATLARQMLEVDGTKKLGQQLMSVADDVTDAYLEFAKKNILAVSQFGRGGAMADFTSKSDAEAAIRRSGLVGKAIVLPIKRGENRVILSPSEAMNRKVWSGDGDKRITLTKDAGMELVQAIGRKGNKENRLTVPWQFETAAERLKALGRIGIETPSEFRSAIREFIAMRVQAQEADRVKAMERAMVGRKNDGLDFFPTPAEVADQMVEAAGIEPDMAVLEPSAGMGHLADRIRAAGAEPDVVELSGDRRELLTEKGFNVIGTDFMAIEPRSTYTYGDVFRHKDGRVGILGSNGGMGSTRFKLIPMSGDKRVAEWVDIDDLTGIEKRGSSSGYDRIIMNPPFGDRRDAAHVQHAYSMLKPGGRLVAIMGEGVFFGKDKKAEEFRDWLDGLGGTSEKLPAGSFMDTSLPVTTGVNARMVVVDKPVSTIEANQKPSVIRAKEQPLTPASTIRAAITKAYGNLLDKLEAKGLVTIAQTEREAIEAAAQARADKTGGDVEKIKRQMLASVQMQRAMPDTIMVDGVERPTANSNGQPIHPTEQGVVNFWRWFGDDSNVDANGRPKVLYHSTLDDKTVFDRNGKFMGYTGTSGISLTDNPEMASRYLDRYGSTRYDGVPFQKNVMPVYAKFGKVLTRQEPLKTSYGLGAPLPANYVAAHKAMGYDTLIRSDAISKKGAVKHSDAKNAIKGNEYVLTEPTQIKSATGNDGSFNPADMDIRRSANGNIEGFFDRQTGKSFLVADNLTAASAPGTLMHEVGIHMAADGKLEPLFKRAGSLLKTGTQNEFIQRVKARMARAGETSDEEAAAYIVTEYENDRAKAPITIGKWIADLTAAVRAWLFSKGIILKADQLTVADIAAVARANARSMARGGPNGGLGGGQAFSRNVGDAAPDEVQRVQAAIEGKSLIEAAMFLTRSSNKANAAIAQKVAEKLKMMESIGVDLKLHIVHRGDMAPAALANSRGYTESGFDSKGSDVAVWLNGADVAGKVGTEEEVLLHELVHAATTGMVHYGAMNPDTQAGRSMKDLMAVTDAIADHIKQRFADAEAGKVTLTEFELDMREGANNAFRSDDEVLAWALSNAEAQQYLEGIPYKSGSLWSNFVRSVRALLGMSPEMDTALSEVLRVAERLLTDDPAKTGRSAFWHKRGLRMIQQQGRGSIVQTQTRTALPATLNIDGKDRPTTNSNGQPIHPTEEGVRNFWKWFADSRVVDEQGRPLVVYHGTASDVDMFDAKKTGSATKAKSADGVFWFSDSAELAEDYAGFAKKKFGKNGARNIMPVYLQMSDPKIVDMGGKEYRELSFDFGGFVQTAKKGVRSGTDWVVSPKDGVILRNFSDTPSGRRLVATHYAVFLPTQIKSATGNTGAFSPTDPDIRFSRGGGIDNADMGTVGENDSPSSQWDAPLASSWDDKIYKLQDKNIDTKRVIQAIKKMAGDIQDKLNVYLQEELYHGRTAKRVLEFGRGELNPALDELAAMGYSIPDLEEYMHARHAPEANVVLAARNPTREMIDTARAEAKAEIKRLKAELSVDGLGKDEAKALKAELKKAEAKLKSWTGVAAFKGTEEERNSLSGMKTEEAEAYFRNLPSEDAAKLKKVAEKMDAIMAETSGMMVAYHLESQETVDGWNAMYRHYIPLHRDGKDDGSMGTGQGFSIKGREVKGRTGSKRKVVNIVAHIAEAREKTIVRGEKNRIAQALVGLVTKYPNADFWKTGAPPSERVFDRATGKVKNQVNPAYKSLPNVVMAKVMGEDGKVKEVAVTFNEGDERAVRMAGALKNLDTPQIEGWLGTVSKATRYFAAVNTQFNPIFGAVNIVRDVQGAMINLGATPLADQKMKIARDTVDALAGIYRDIRATRRGEVGSSKWSELYEQFQHDGGQTGFRNLFETTDDRSQELKDRVSPTDWAKSPLGRIMSANGKLTKQAQWMRDGWAIARDWLSDYNETMESATRLAVYKAALDKGMTREQAASMAKNITVNFNRKGTMGTQAGALYAFFNAAMQGTARMGETLVTMEPGKPKTMRLSAFGKKVVYGGIVLGAVQALALAAGGFGDEEPPDFERERNLLIPTGWTGVGPDKGYIKIPMPLGLHVIPGIGRMGMEFALSGGEDPAKAAIKFGGMMADAFNPIGNAGLSMQTIAPTVLDPLAALVENKDWTGKNIARESFNKDAPMFSQHKDSATLVAKFLAELVNYATGGNEYVGGALNWSPDQIDYLIGQVTGGVGRELSKVEQTATGAFTGDETPIYKVPLLGRFAGSASGKSGEANAFYTNADKLNRLETELKGMVKDGKSAAAAALRMERPESRMIVGFNMAERQVQKLRKQKSALIEAGASAADVRAVDERITAIMQNMNQRMLSVAGN